MTETTATLRCTCGYQHTPGADGWPDWIAVESASYGKLVDLETALRVAQSGSEAERLRQEIDKLVSRFYLCPECGTVIWQRELGRVHRVLK